MTRNYDNWGPGRPQGSPLPYTKPRAGQSCERIPFLVGATLAVALARFAITFTVAFTLFAVALVWNEE